MSGKFDLSCSSASLTVSRTPHGPRLKAEFDALFTLIKFRTATCSRCETSQEREDSSGPGLTIHIRHATSDTVYAGSNRDRSNTIESDPDNIAKCPIVPPCVVAEGIDDGVDIGFERTIDAAPEYLSFFLDRVNPVTGEKSTTRVAIPDILDLTPYIRVPEGALPVPLRCKLLHGAYHRGTGTKEGHYATGVTGAPLLPNRSKNAQTTSRKEKVRRAICHTRSSGLMTMMFKAGPALAEM